MELRQPLCKASSRRSPANSGTDHDPGVPDFRHERTCSLRRDRQCLESETVGARLFGRVQQLLSLQESFLWPRPVTVADQRAPLPRGGSGGAQSLTRPGFERPSQPELRVQVRTIIRHLQDHPGYGCRAGRIFGPHPGDPFIIGERPVSGFC